MQQVNKPCKKRAKKKKNRAYNIQKKRSSRLPLHAITLDVLSTKQHEHFLRSFNMTGTTGRSVCFVLRRHDSVIELASLYHSRQICTNSLLQGCTGDLGKDWTECKTVKQSSNLLQYHSTAKMYPT